MEFFRTLEPFLASTKPSIIAFVGAGGKTSAMFDVAEQARAAQFSIIVTTTTAIVDPRTETGRSFDFFAFEHELPPRCPKGTITILATLLRAGGKVAGPDPNAIEALRDRADLILVEADGSRGLPIKAPSHNEPCIPPGADLVIGCFGLDALGRSATGDTVHRLAEFLAVTGLEKGSSIDVEALGKLVVHPQGLFKGCPPSSKRLLCMTKGDCLAEGELRRVKSFALREDLGVDLVLLRSRENLRGIAHAS